jgi:hypothetical protein
MEGALHPLIRPTFATVYSRGENQGGGVPMPHHARPVLIRRGLRSCSDASFTTRALFL